MTADSSPAAPEALAAVTLLDAVRALRKAEDTYAASQYPQVAVILAAHAEGLEQVADASVAQQLERARDACEQLRSIQGGFRRNRT